MDFFEPFKPQQTLSRLAHEAFDDRWKQEKQLEVINRRDSEYQAEYKRVLAQENERLEANHTKWQAQIIEREQLMQDRLTQDEQLLAKREFAKEHSLKVRKLTREQALEALEAYQRQRQKKAEETWYEAFCAFKKKHPVIKRMLQE